jgi:hypothetical protein
MVVDQKTKKWNSGGIHRITRAIRENRFQLIHNKDEFSNPLRYLISTIGHHGEDFLPENSDLFEAISDAIQSGTCHKAAGPSEAAFRNQPGRLSLNLATPQPDDQRHKVRLEGNEFSVLSGFWASPFAASILAENEIDRLIMDMTFRVMRQYHTAVLIAVIRVVGIPLAFSFGPQESIELYDRFSTVFRDEIGIDLTPYILLSDQGAALKSIGRRHPLHRCGLRHILKTFAKFNYGRPVGNLVRCRTKGI